jgi:hypothetical protein
VPKQLESDAKQDSETEINPAAPSNDNDAQEDDAHE